MFPVKKIAIFLFLFILGCSSFAFVLAADLQLEQTYPVVEGVKGIQEIQKLEPDQRLPAYIKYIVRLVFYIAIGICVVLLIT